MSEFYLSLFTLVYVLFAASVVADVCPYQECTCAEDIINCVDIHLTALPKLVASNVSGQPLLDLTKNLITSIPAEGLPKGLGAIDLEANPLTSVDQHAFEASGDTLTSVQFSGASLDDLPFALFDLKNLQTLSVKDSRIGQWTDDMLYYLGQTMQTLVIVNVDFSDSWPEWLGGLSNLKMLEFSGTSVDIPDDANFAFQNMPNLESLTMQNLSLTSTGKIFSQLVNLTNLFLDSNKISGLTGLPSSLTILSLNYNSISDETNLAESLQPVSASLVTLYLSNNRLKSFPSLSFMSKLDTLYLSFNSIADTTTGSVPASLAYLEIKNNELASLSSFLRNSVSLLTLSTSFNSISVLQGIDIPVSVTYFDVSHNLITTLTDTSFLINSQIESLILDSNPISSISTSAFANLKNLTYLSMTNTKLTRLPVSLTNLNGLRSVDLSGNGYLVCTCMEFVLREWSRTNLVAITGMCGQASIEYFLDTLSVDCPS